jgi:hypothetical protein
MSHQPVRDTTEDFEALSVERRPSVVGEFFQFAKENRKWWILPIVLFMLAIGVLIILGGTAAAPFIYTLF